MIEGWEERRLDSLTRKIGSGATPRGGKNAYKEEGISLIRSQNVLDFKFSYKGLAFIDNEQGEALKNVVVEEDDVLLNITGDSVARCAMVERDVLPARVNQHVAIIRCDKSKSDPHFILYSLLQLKGELLSQSEIGATRRALTKGMLESLEILSPSLSEQKAIAEVLSSLDDKIDLLHRQNKTLESLAETLFRQWFIEEVQDDWEEEQLDQMANYLNGLACQKFPAKNSVERLPVLKIKDLKDGFSESSDWATSKVPAEYIIENGDIIFAWSASLIVKLWDGPTCVLNQHLFKVTSERFPDWFIYLWTNHHLRRFIAIAETKATTMGHIKRTDLSEAMVAIPDEDRLSELDEGFAPILSKIISNNRQIKILEDKRDTLLPKLMSGAVRVAYDREAA